MTDEEREIKEVEKLIKRLYFSNWDFTEGQIRRFKELLRKWKRLTKYKEK